MSAVMPTLPDRLYGNPKEQLAVEDTRSEHERIVESMTPEQRPHLLAQAQRSRRRGRSRALARDLRSLFNRMVEANEGDPMQVLHRQRESPPGQGATPRTGSCAIVSHAPAAAGTA